jgi:hypothetical protein
MMKRITAILLILLSASVCLASGWNDFTLDIGDGYNVFRANSLDVCIGRADGSLILSPRDHDKVGPIVNYISTPDYILTKNLGRTPRKLFEGDTFQEVDPSHVYFFVIVKANDEVRGPFSTDEFSQRPEVASLGQLDWQIPKNPNFWTPLLGNLMFLAFAIPILAIKFFWITIPLIIAMALLIRHVIKKRRAKAQPSAAADGLPPAAAP